MTARRLALAALLLFGCGHAKTVEHRQEPAAQTAHAPSGVPIGPTPSSVLRPGAARQIQRALDDKGYRVKRTGQLDRDTHKALERFQRDQKMATTGLPDLETLRLLGLDPTKLYRHE